MHISSYERDLAVKNGRGRQMNQAGTRAWGSMEPAPKRFHGGQYSMPTPQIPTMQRWQPPSAFPPPPPAFPPPPQQWQPPSGHQANQFGNVTQHQQAATNVNVGVYNQQTMRAMAGNNYRHPTQPQQWPGNNTHPNQQSFPPHQQQNNGYSPNHHNNQRNEHQGGFAFNQHGQQRQMHQQQHQQQSNHSFNRQGVQQQQPQSGGQANLTNLRAQLMSTLQKQRKG